METTLITLGGPSRPFEATNNSSNYLCRHFKIDKTDFLKDDLLKFYSELHFTENTKRNKFSIASEARRKS